MADSLFTELKRRNVFKVGIAYLVLAWVVMQVTDIAIPALHLPEWIITAVFFFGVVGFPFALFFAWVFEITSDGVKRESEIKPEDSITSHTGRKLDFIIIILLVIVAGYFIYESRFETIITEPVVIKDSAGLVNSAEDFTELEDSSIAILPFVNMSSDKEQEYFSDGLSEEILNLLVQIPQLRVIARTSSFSFKGKDITVSDIAKELNVTHILEGSVRNSGSKLRITAQLIRTSDSTHLWSETYDRQITDVFAVQDEIAQAVVESMKVTLLPEQQLAFNIGKTTNVEAYKLYLRSRSLMAKRGKKNLNHALILLDAATIIDAAFADAFAAKAMALSIILNFDPSWSKERTVAEAEKAISKALAINPNNVEAIIARATVQFFINTEWRAAEKNLLRALELSPNNASVHNFLGDYYSFTMSLEKSLLHEKRAIELDPISSVHKFDLAQVYASKGNRVKQIELLYSIPEFSVGFDYLTMVLLAENKIEEARNVWSTKHTDLSGKESLHIFAMQKLIEMVDKKHQNYDKIPDVITQALDQNLIFNIYVGRIFYIRGDISNALKYYNIAYQAGEAYIRHISFSGTRDLYLDHEGWQAFWNLEGMKELETIRAENAHLD